MSREIDGFNNILVWSLIRLKSNITRKNIASLFLSIEQCAASLRKCEKRKGKRELKMHRSGVICRELIVSESLTQRNNYYP